MKTTEKQVTIQQQFGKNMRIHRKRLGYTLSDVALLTQMDRTHLNLIELAKRNATLETTQKIASALQTTVIDLLE